MLAFGTYAARPSMSSKKPTIPGLINDVKGYLENRSNGDAWYHFNWLGFLMQCDDNTFDELTKDLLAMRHFYSDEPDGSAGAFDFFMAKLEDKMGYSFFPAGADLSAFSDWPDIQTLGDMEKAG